MAESDFVEIKKSEDALDGNRQIILCGFKTKDFVLFKKVMIKVGLKFSLLFVANSKDLKRILSDINMESSRNKLEKFSVLPRAVIAGGISQSEFFDLMSAVKKTSIKTPLWATLTPTSLTWTLEALLDELKQEKLAMANQKNSLF
ncbi:MAG: DUF3783 domain-containing protein [Deltaproteobacteria bacterium]|nr:DUF3783 domain-containing protein [Deltaproteobacteria bacterium]